MISIFFVKIEKAQSIIPYYYFPSKTNLQKKSLLSDEVAISASILAKKKQIRSLKYEKDRVAKLIELMNK